MDVNANQPETKTFKETEGAGGIADSQSQKRKAQAQKNTMQKKIKDPVQARKYKVHGEIGQHAKHNNFKGALETFKEVVQEGLPLNLGLYNALLYVTTGGNDWECYTRGRVLPALKIEGTAGMSDDSDRASTSKAELISATQAVWSHLKVSGVNPDNSTYVSLARIEAIKGDAAAALQWAHSCEEAGQPVTLRLYHPALVSYT
ncbi:hypothetical protein CEUSTIGMA_g11094.t1 [Chlamydomonas eustigma]|uniref:Uncharacterized protein n=1 Tax=Chlamydomonas eustigma TaxID=1157962 RepID=A0A250XL67_9CHLO|nr:hypothetical protein CEUSTIGMA_g11094.t1 [Chlamydomonas eustigma]|eukprot:GAX83669.1 hypothetical protein CEUSTIGMA_g11094.t1 [Chlamydomonas eustigma]